MSQKNRSEIRGPKSEVKKFGFESASHYAPFSLVRQISK